LDANTTSLNFKFKTLDSVLIYLAEYGYQIFKILSQEDGFEWEYKILADKKN